MAEAAQPYEALPEEGGVPAYNGNAESSQLLKDANAQIRRGFVRKVYGILSCQLLLTCLVAVFVAQQTTFIGEQESYNLRLAASIGSLVSICAIACCPQLGKRFPLNYLILFVFTACEGAVVGLITNHYSVHAVVLAVAATAFIFISMTVYASCTKSDFTGMGPFLFGALLALICSGIMFAVIGWMGYDVSLMHKLAAAAGVVIFTIFIVYDTQLMLGGKKHSLSIDEYVFAAINLYLDILNLFLDLLRLFSDD